jgi:hypothetical protein
VYVAVPLDGRYTCCRCGDSHLRGLKCKRNTCRKGLRGESRDVQHAQQHSSSQAAAIHTQRPLLAPQPAREARVRSVKVLVRHSHQRQRCLEACELALT